MAPQLGAPSGETGYEDGAGDDALPPVSGRESTTKQWRSATACAHVPVYGVLRNYHDSQKLLKCNLQGAAWRHCMSGGVRVAPRDK